MTSSFTKVAAAVTFMTASITITPETTFADGQCLYEYCPSNGYFPEIGPCDLHWIDGGSSASCEDVIEACQSYCYAQSFPFARVLECYPDINGTFGGCCECTS